ncbi:hypothetical protein KM427_01885 [Nocardioides sp. LMS-CY]|uniref:Uncharacterized protein n=1 Tax=Nocardioides soli TaxID=1036020 RepID=A0A7W4VV68_9ACTN|nr:MULTISPECIES: hypothetical protein [Nocardioides]MBB3042354.1 hypothetical protein [Nocardioides soli]QWF22522.1 hypothetical protein KM427_01885 [Nocardioides sp. LMS-CY]
MSAAPDGSRPGPDAVPEVSEFRFAPAFAARLVGGLLVVLAVLLVVTTVVVAVASLPFLVLVLVALIGVVGVLVAGNLLTRRLPVVHLGPDGYRVRLVRGAGTSAAAWTEVREAVTTASDGLPVVVLRLADGGTTTIPVSLLDVDREEFVRVLQGHLQRGQGLTPLS